MARFDDEIAVALELIEESGEKVTYTQIKPGTQDTDQPWKTSGRTETTKKPFICFVPTSDTQWRKFLALMKGTEVPTGKLAGLMGAQKFEPKLRDIVTRGDGTVLTITNIDKLSPNGQVVLWTFEFDK